MINNLPNKFPIILIILLALFTFWVDKTVRQPTKGQVKELLSNPDYVMEDFSTYSMNHISGAHQKLFAKKMLHYVDNDTTYLEQPRLINSKIGTPKMRVRADRANMSGNEDIYLSGNVRVVRYGEDETTMITSFLHVIPDNDIAKTNKPVTITQDNTIISAVGMEIDNNAQIIYLLSEVKFVHDKIR
jgi:lipopolysaccharide export system protein LptC